MSYSMSSWAPEFWFAEGEPYDASERAVNRHGNPVSVWSAIEMALAEVPTSEHPDGFSALRLDMAEFLGCAPEHVTPEAVLELIEETDTCDSLSSPIEVWIDPEGDMCVTVYE